MKKIAECGTRSGYNRQLKLKEEVCKKCRLAQNEYDKKRFEKNPDYFKIKNKKNENLENKKARWRRREALKNNGLVEKYLDKDVINLYGNLCHICNKEIDLSASRRSGIGYNWQYGLHIDHVIPIIMGGNDTLDNVRPSHAICNLKKGRYMLVKEL